MNQVNIIARITKELELKYTPNGNAVVSFDVAVPKRKKEDGANFFKVVAWNKTAESLTQYCGKGSQIGITGRLDQRSYEKDGKKVYVTEIVADTVDFLSKSESGEQSSAPAPKKNEPFGPGKQYTGADDEDIDLDLPF